MKVFSGCIWKSVSRERTQALIRRILYTTFHFQIFGFQFLFAFQLMAVAFAICFSLYLYLFIFIFILCFSLHVRRLLFIYLFVCLFVVVSIYLLNCLDIHLELKIYKRHRPPHVDCFAYKSLCTHKRKSTAPISML